MFWQGNFLTTMNKYEITFLVREAEEVGYYAEGMEAAIC
jgi:hypothetical protein